MAEKTDIKKKRSLFHKIVNAFLGVLIGILVILVVLVGISQTESFREFLRKTVISEVNSSLNGKINIERIDGTIFTSLILTNTSLTLDRDTILYSGKISLKTSPLQILLKKIYVREFELSGAKIALLKDSSGKFNISRLVKPKKADTVKSKFPFTINVNELRIINSSLRIADGINKNSYRSYNTLNFNDLRVDSLNLLLSAFADISGNSFQLKIDALNFRANLLKFKLYKMSGYFDLTDHYARVNDLYLKTNSSDFNLTASMEDVNFFNHFRYEKLKTSPVKISLDARLFDFSDLTSFVSATDIMQGTVKANIEASGPYGDLNIQKLALDYLQTHLELNGNVKNLHVPSDLFIKAELYNSKINQDDVHKLLPGIKSIPDYKGLVLDNIEAEYEGTPKKFIASLRTDLPKGSIESKADLDFSGQVSKYDISVSTKELDLEPVIKSRTSLNSNISFRGESFSPQKMNSTAHIQLLNSSFRTYYADSLDLSGSVRDGQLAFRLITSSAGANFRADANVDYRDTANAIFSLNGRVARLNLSRFVNDTSLSSNLNFTFALDGQSFDFEKMDSHLRMNILPSVFKDMRLDTTALNIAYIRQNDNKRLIRLDTDFAVFTLLGDYSLDDAIDMMTYQSDVIVKLIKQKIYEINPYALFNDSLKAANFEMQLKLARQENPPVFKKNISLDYNLFVKDFGLIAAFAGVNTIDTDGRFFGTIKNTASDFYADANIVLDKLKITSKTNVTYVSNLNFYSSISRDNSAVRFDNMKMDLKLNTDRVFSNTDLKDVFVMLNLNNSDMNYSVSAQMDTTASALLQGSAKILEHGFDLSVDTLVADYKSLTWKNDSALIAHYDKNEFSIDKFRLVRNGSAIDLKGSVYGDGKENLRLDVSHLDAELLNNLLGLSQENLSSDLNISMLLNGYLHDPVIDLKLKADKIRVNDKNFGSLDGKFDYSKKMLKTDVVFVDSLMNFQAPLLTVKGDIPVDLGFVGVTQRLPSDKPVDIAVRSENFDIAVLSELIPYTYDVRGKLSAGLKIGGTTEQFNYGGNISLSNAVFTSSLTNLTYGLDINLKLQNESVLVDNFVLSNQGGSNYRGRLTGSGSAQLKAAGLETAELNVSGDLALLSEASRAVSPNYYGDVVIQTGNDWRYTYNKGNSEFNGKVLLKEAELTIIPPSSSYGSENEYNYHFPVDSVRIDKKQDEFNQIVSLSKKYSSMGKPQKSSSSKKTGFKYNVSLEIKDEATVYFVVDRVSNQRLTAVLDGQMIYESGGVAQGKFNLLEGSKLDYFKTFDASGSIYFESDPTNPRLDVVATYKSEHSDSAAGESQMVAVKIKIQGRVQELSKNFIQASEDKIAVYVGESDIENDVPDPQYDASDAISFIITGSFKDELTANEKSQAAFDLSRNVTGYTTSILGGLIGSFANSQLGDIVKDFEVEKRGTSTRVSLSGRFQNFRYSLGGSDETLQDISKANLSFEYPFTDRLFFRFQRKDPILEASSLNEKINELSLRYKFIF